jgi:hypothetical protein
MREGCMEQDERGVLGVSEMQGASMRDAGSIDERGMQGAPMRGVHGATIREGAQGGLMKEGCDERGVHGVTMKEGCWEYRLEMQGAPMREGCR